MSAGPDDREVIGRVAGRDPAGLELLYDRYATLVYSLALRILRDAADAEDVTQEVFAQVWTQAARFDASRGVVAAWITIIARSRALDRLRRRGAVPNRQAADEALADIPDPAPSVELMAATSEQVSSARDALAQLPPEQRLAIELAYFEGLTQAQIAARTATPLGTVKTRMRAGLQRIRDAVASHAASPRSQA